MKREVNAAGESARATVAIRMIQLQARTQTIMAATRMSEDQVRRLYRQYCRGEVASRQRGRSPTSAGQFTKTLPMRFESSLLAGVLLKHGLIKGLRPKPWLSDSLEYAQRFCVAYAEYQPLACHQALSFEQAWYFAKNLATLAAISLKRCGRCVSYFVHDDTDVRRQECPMCQLHAQWSEAHQPIESAVTKRKSVRPRARS